MIWINTNYFLFKNYGEKKPPRGDQTSPSLGLRHLFGYRRAYIHYYRHCHKSVFFFFFYCSSVNAHYRRNVRKLLLEGHGVQLFGHNTVAAHGRGILLLVQQQNVRENDQVSDFFFIFLGDTGGLGFSSKNARGYLRIL